jgi:hypothetical protein
MVDNHLLWGIDDTGIISKLQHPQHCREYAVGQKEGQALGK